MSKKYILTDVSKEVFGIKLFQIKALVSFGSVTKDELGGWVEKEENLSQKGNAWVFGNASVSGNARVFGNASVFGNAEVSGNARVFGNASVFGDASVSGNAEVSGDASVSGNAGVCAKSKFTSGWFIGGDDSGKITDITDKMGSTYWKNQYVLGYYKIEPIEKNEEKVNSLKGKEVEVKLDGVVYKAIIQ